MALACMGSLLGADALPQVTVAGVDWQRLRPAYEARRRRPLFAEMEERTKVAAESEEDGVVAPWISQLSGLDSGARKMALLDLVRQAVAVVARSASSEASAPQQGLFEMGLDSLMSVELKGLLEKGVGRPLPATLTFNYPTPGDLTQYLEGLIFPQAAASAPEAEAAPEPAGEAIEADDLDDLSEDDLEEMLQKRLNKLS